MLYLILLAAFTIAWLYGNYFMRIDIPDTYVKDKLIDVIVAKNKKRHPGFVGTLIAPNSNTHRIARDKNGELYREEIV